jgi:DNA-directed RNA polymerase specialized sigma24 family protein
MAAGTTLEPMTMAPAEPSATQDFSEVVATYRPQIFRFLLASTRDVDLAETLTQDCFLKAHRHWEGLRERQRTVFLLRYVDEMEISEIGRAAGLNEGTVKAHLSRALARVRAELGGRR